MQVAAAAINSVDVQNVLGQIPSTTLPRVPGRYFAGEVVSGEAKWRDRFVLATGGDLGFGRDGSHAEYVTVPVEAVVEIPPGTDFVNAAASSLAYLTAYTALRRLSNVWLDKSLLVTGATGSVGSAAVRLATSEGARVLGTARSPKDVEGRADLPAIEWIDLSSRPLAESVRQATGGQGVEMIVDTVGAPLFNECLGSLRQRGRQAAVGSAGDPKVTLSLVDFYRRDATLIGINTLQLTFNEASEALDSVLSSLQKDPPPPPPVREISLEQARDAYEVVHDSPAIERPVIRFDHGNSH